MRGELFQHLSLGQVLNRTISMFMDRFDVYMALSTAVLVPLLVVGLLITAVIGMEVLDFVSKSQVVDENGMEVYDEDDVLANFFLYVSTHLKSLVFWGMVKLLLGLVITVSGEAGIVRAAAETYAAEDGQPTNYHGWYACLMQFGVQQLGRLWLGRLYMELPVDLGFSVWVIWLVSGLEYQSNFLLATWVLVFGAWIGLAVWWYPSVLLTVPVMVVEQKGPKNAIRRSFEITQGRRCYVVCALLILKIVKIIVAQLLQNIFNGQDSALEAVFKPAGIVIGLVPELLYMPLHTILTFCLYASIRADTEGLTQAVLQRELIVQPMSYMAPSTDYRQVALMDETDDTVAQGLVSDFA